jgi:hypothetical protein
MASNEVGFFDTPSKFARKLEALDKLIQQLSRAVEASSSPRVNAAWRTEFAAFLRRWTLERDQYVDWDARTFLTYANYRFSKFEESYKWWARDFERRTLTKLAPVPAVPSQGLAEAWIAPEVWWILGAGVAFYAFASARRR